MSVLPSFLHNNSNKKIVRKICKNYFLRMVHFSDKIDKDILGPNFFNPKLTGPKLFQTKTYASFKLLWTRLNTSKPFWLPFLKKTKLTGPKLFQTKAYASFKLLWTCLNTSKPFWPLFLKKNIHFWHKFFNFLNKLGGGSDVQYTFLLLKNIYKKDQIAIHGSLFLGTFPFTFHWRPSFLHLIKYRRCNQGCDCGSSGPRPESVGGDRYRILLGPQYAPLDVLIHIWNIQGNYDGLGNPKPNFQRGCAPRPTTQLPSEPHKEHNVPPLLHASCCNIHLLQMESGQCNGPGLFDELNIWLNEEPPRQEDTVRKSQKLEERQGPLSNQKSFTLDLSQPDLMIEISECDQEFSENSPDLSEGPKREEADTDQKNVPTVIWSISQSDQMDQSMSRCLTQSWWVLAIIKVASITGFIFTEN